MGICDRVKAALKSASGSGAVLSGGVKKQKEMSNTGGGEVLYCPSSTWPIGHRTACTRVKGVIGESRA